MASLSKSARSPEAEAVVQELVVRDGRSYENVIQECEHRAERAAQKARAPYDEVAAELRQWLREHGYA